MFATYLRRKGCSVAILDCPAEGLTAWQAANRALEYEATLYVMVVYGFQPSSSTQNMTFAGEMARSMKGLDDMQSHGHKCKILMTGTHPAALPERTLREEAIDVVATGEGPQAIYGALQAIKAGHKDFGIAPGVMWKVGGVPGFCTADTGLLDDLDAEMPAARGTFCDGKVPRAQLALLREYRRAFALCVDSHVARLSVQMHVLLYQRAVWQAVVSDVESEGGRGRDRAARHQVRRAQYQIRGRDVRP